MNALEILAKELELEIPEAEIRIDKPGSKSGTWQLDANLGDRAVVISWKPEHPFGVSTPSSVEYGEYSHEVYKDRLSAAKRAVQLLQRGGKTNATSVAALKDVRLARKVSQQELAAKLRVLQASVSKFENRKDMQISTLQKVVDQLGGQLEIYARFPDESFRIVQPGSPRITREKVQIYVEAKHPRTRKRRGTVAIPAKSANSPEPYETYDFVINAAGEVEGEPFRFKNSSSIKDMLQIAERGKLLKEYKWETVGHFRPNPEKENYGAGFDFEGAHGLKNLAHLDRATSTRHNCSPTICI